MWDKGKLLLVASILVALYYKATAKLLDMAMDAVDDTYHGCREQALEKFIHSGLLGQELNRSKGFKNAWSQDVQCSKLPAKMKEHTAALLAYANGDENFIKTFDNAVETLGTNVSVYENRFHFKSLHFLLMDSMTLLPPKQCQTMYAVSEEKYIAKKGSKVRLGTFAEVHSNVRELTDFDEDGLVRFNITSCFFVNLGANICREEDAVLLSPAEVFTVEDVNEVSDPDGSEYTEIVLKHSEVSSSHNCYIFSREAEELCDFINPDFSVCSPLLKLHTGPVTSTRKGGKLVCSQEKLSNLSVKLLKYCPQLVSPPSGFRW